jgi:DNA repair exonuclease SbcCD ATPase subunit
MDYKFQDEIDDLFKLPLAEFIAARNSLATRLKQSGHASDANLVKTLAKPSVSAWTVNQLYWNHREEFDELLAAGQRVRKAQTSSLAGKVGDMRTSLDARREALTNLADLATTLLRDAGHNPSLDTIRRVTTTLEALSAVSDGPTPGRLSEDVDPPGFESLASFVPLARTTKAKATAEPASQKEAAAQEERELEKTRQVRIAAAKASVQSAKKSLADARAKAQSLEAAHKKAYADAKQAEKQLREAEVRLKKATEASEAASERAETIAAEVEEATDAVEVAKRAVEKASKELEKMFSKL